MAKSTTPGQFQPPSAKGVAIGSGIALVVALIVLVVAVWPAEYGKDPTGIGSLLGITGMSGGATQTIALVDTLGGNESIREVTIPDFGEPVPLPNPRVSQIESTPPAMRTMTVNLAVDGETEVKTVLREGKMIVYDWQVDDGIVYSDFHGHNPEYGSDFWVRYKEDQQGASSGSGSLVAPFDGEHGWYWVNLSDHPVTVTLQVTGFFDEMIDYSDQF
jgi:hypothetical protein